MFGIACKNVTRRPTTSLASALIVALAVFAVVAATTVVWAIDDGMRLSRERLGADVMVLPVGASTNASQVLFTAAPVNVYLPADALEQVAAVEGVAQASPQFFTQTVDESCCSVVGVTRVVGIDTSTDFVVTPWLEERNVVLGSGGLLVGSAAPRIEGGIVSILGEEFDVAGYLQPTGTSVDETIFMEIDSARRIAEASPYLTSLWQDADADEAVSCVMVKLSDGVDSQEAATRIMEQCPGTAAVATSQMIAGVSDQLRIVRIVLGVMLALLVAVAALAYAGRIGALAQSRMKELGLMRTLGAGTRSVMGCLAAEAGLLTAVGAVVGIAAGCACGQWAAGQLHAVFNLPGALDVGLLVRTGGVGLLFAVALGILCLLPPLVKLGRTDPIHTLARGDLQ